jgi:hypothetical protein
MQPHLLVWNPDMEDDVTMQGPSGSALSIGPDFEGPQHFLAPGPLSPTSTLAALATIPNLNATACSIILGLVGTITNREDCWKCENANMEKEINKLGFKVGLLEE